MSLFGRCMPQSPLAVCSIFLDALLPSLSPLPSNDRNLSKRTRIIPRAYLYRAHGRRTKKFSSKSNPIRLIDGGGDNCDCGDGFFLRVTRGLRVEQQCDPSRAGGRLCGGLQVSVVQVSEFGVSVEPEKKRFPVPTLLMTMTGIEGAAKKKKGTTKIDFSC